MAAAILPVILYVLSAFFLIHSAYSAYEFSYLLKHFAHATTSSKNIVPLDIKIEAIIGALLAVFGAVLTKVDTLKPIKFSEAIVEDEQAGNGPFDRFERRTIFQNVVERRKEYLAWLKQQEQQSEKI